MLVDGHTTQVYELDYGKKVLRAAQRQGALIVDDETRQLTKIEGLHEDSVVTVYPAVVGG